MTNIVFKKIISLFLFLCVNSLLAIEEDLYYGVPTIESYPYSITILDNERFAIGYCETRRAPVWVSYRLFPNPGKYSFELPTRFRTDHRTQSRISHDHYIRSSFDRGDLAPNDTIMTRYGRAGQTATTFMSNIAPMTPLFHRGIWNKLEELVAEEYSNSFEEVWVVTGTIYDIDIQRLATGIEIADAFLKIVIDEVDGKPRTQAFVIPHTNVSGLSLADYLTSIDEVEKVTGFDLFSELPDEIEDELEMKISPSIWTSDS